MNLISIIIPIYNIEKYLPRCFDSILAQTYQKFEVVAVDDGSTDNSFQVCLDYAKRDSRIIPVHQENGGASKARNTGITKSTGDYIAFVDGDDFLHSDYLLYLLDSIRTNNTMISMCGLECVDAIGDMVESHFSNNSVPEKICGRDAVCQIGRNVTFGVVWNKLYKREIFDEIRFTEGMTYEDEMILHHIYGKVDEISCVRKNLYYYVQRPGSKMKESYSPAKMDIIIAYMDRIQFLVEYQYSDEEVLRVNNKLVEFFRTAAVKGRESKLGRDKFKRLCQEYRCIVYPKLPEYCRTISMRLFIKFPIVCSYFKTIKIRVLKCLIGR